MDRAAADAADVMSGPGFLTEVHKLSSKPLPPSLKLPEFDIIRFWDGLEYELEQFRKAVDTKGHLTPRITHELAFRTSELLQVFWSFVNTTLQLKSALRQARTDAEPLWRVVGHLAGELCEIKMHLEPAQRVFRRLRNAGKVLPPLSRLSDEDIADLCLHEAHLGLQQAYQRIGKTYKIPEKFLKAKQKLDQMKSSTASAAAAGAGPRTRRRRPAAPAERRGRKKRN